MHRPSIDDDEMMLFIFPYKQNVRLWMYNVHFDLDAAFLDEQLNILQISHLQAFPDEKDPSFFFDKMAPSPIPVKYVLEAKHGFFELNNLKVGDTVRPLIPGRILHEQRIHHTNTP